MPTYEYECDECHAIIEEFRPIGDRDEPARCGCGGSASRVFVTPPAGKVEEDWSTDNGGKGRNITQLCKNRNERAYFQSRNQLEEHCKKLKDQGKIRGFERA